MRVISSASSNPANVVQVIALVITHRSTLALPISSTLAYYHTKNNHLDNISGIQTRAIEITLILKLNLGWKKDM